MKTTSLFPSRYIKADDLSEPRTLKIKEVVMEEMNDGVSKPTIYFVGEPKGLVLNKTNAEFISLITNSDDTDGWVGHRVELHKDLVLFRGQATPCVRVRQVAPVSKAKPEPPEDEESN